MSYYDIQKVKKLSKTPKTDYFKNPKQKQKQKKQKKKTSTSFWDVPSQYTTEDNLDLNYDYLELEQKLKINTKQWGVNNVSEQIIELIKDYYQNFKENNPKYDDSTLFNSFYPVAKKTLKQGYQHGSNVLPPLPQDIKKLILATYSLSIDKLKNWRDNLDSEPKEQSQTIEPQIKEDETEKLKKLTQNIANLIIEQGIYLEEQKVHHPIINTKR